MFNESRVGSQLDVPENFVSWDEEIIEKARELVKNKEFLTDKDKETFTAKAERLLNNPNFIEKRADRGNWTKQENTKENKNQLADGLILAIIDEEETE